jgi:predicted dinucleotide-binding enzyme
MTTVGIIGSGDVGKTLAAGFVKHGYSVQIGTRDPSKLAEFVKQNPAVKVGSVEDAAKFGTLIVVATAGGAAVEALAAAGHANLKGKTVIDANNPISGAPVDGVLPYSILPAGSLLETLQAAVPDAHFVKAFSSVGASQMINPSFKDGVRPTMFICGNDADAKKTVTHVLDQFGWDTKDFGKARAAEPIERLAQLWCILGFNNNQWTHAFKLLEQH